MLAPYLRYTSDTFFPSHMRFFLTGCPQSLPLPSPSLPSLPIFVFIVRLIFGRFEALSSRFTGTFLELGCCVSPFVYLSFLYLFVYLYFFDFLPL
jgi:hypothetical protein